MCEKFSHRSDLVNGIFARVFARIVKVTDFAQVINFRERTQGKIHPRKVNKNKRDSTNLLLFFGFFSAQQ